MAGQPAGSGSRAFLVSIRAPRLCPKHQGSRSARIVSMMTAQAVADQLEDRAFSSMPGPARCAAFHVGEAASVSVAFGYAKRGASCSRYQQFTVTRPPVALSSCLCSAIGTICSEEGTDAYGCRRRSLDRALQRTR
jgi:hypothetical protein